LLKGLLDLLTKRGLFGEQGLWTGEVEPLAMDQACHFDPPEPCGTGTALSRKPFKLSMSWRSQRRLAGSKTGFM